MNSEEFENKLVKLIMRELRGPDLPAEETITNPQLGAPLREEFNTHYSTPSSHGAATQPLDGPPEGLVARVWAPNTNAFSPGEVWVATQLPITIWAGPDAITSWYDRWARPRRIVTGPMASLRYTVTSMNTTDIAAAQVIVWNAVGSFTGIPQPPAFLGNTVLPAAPIGPSGAVVNPYTVSPAPSGITSTIDSTGWAAPEVIQPMIEFQWNGTAWVSTGMFNTITGAPDNRVVVIDRAIVTFITVTQTNVSVSVNPQPVNAFGTGTPFTLGTATFPATGAMVNLPVASSYSPTAVAGLNYHAGNDNYRPTGPLSLYWLGDRAILAMQASITNSGTPPTNGDRIRISIAYRELNIVLRAFPGAAPYLPESISGYTFP